MNDAPVAAARRLVAGLLAEPFGRVAPSVYETARLVVLAPWLSGHAARVRFLVERQHPDGTWGMPGGYALVPTLSAVEALAAVRRGDVPSWGTRADLASAVDRGTRALKLLLDGRTPLPDTPAIELIVPALAERLALLTPFDRTRLAALRERIADGRPVPPKARHFLEVLGDGPAQDGIVGASPAATAARLSPAGADFLRTLTARHGGPVPCPTPIPAFETAWVLSWIARSGMPVEVPPALLDSLAAGLGPTGIATGPGLPTDADTTAVTLYALSRLGRPPDRDALWHYRTAHGFCTWPGEDGFSVSTNAHVLEALGRRSGESAALTQVLVGRQLPDGSWQDRWHASPYYATVSCALALESAGRGPAVAAALRRATEWVRATQRADGSWGRFTATAEETAYALHLLARRPGPVDDALRRGTAFLRAAVDHPRPTLWYGKELYLPESIVEAAILSALFITREL
ncbi:hypothetical protein Val02_04050 [Virgisporangium aliadipatigenens]|uniref:Squalene cyclase C-terminal domain-containing protein n=1 Tax=Virgisporangium aliadipatigenens TaxID=741659 RepID=A0A8J3YEA2_9ACTN|nr:prenyltransferase/squalene oxidase repeat-containing protein [Virgisporangium aliadipatigenens]GIJ43519.1 hypothetical protein Val02_04050 [Virgisporangium aliadipatigenens]